MKHQAPKGRKSSNPDGDAREGRRLNKPRPPARRYQGIERVWSERHRCWMWRGRNAWIVEGVRVQRTGTLRADQQAAHQDYLALCQAAAPMPDLDADVTLDGAIQRVRRMDQERYIPESTLRGVIDAHGRALTRFFGPSALLMDIGEAEVRLFCRRGLEDGRHPNTIRTKDLPLLRRAAEAAGHVELAEIVARVRKDLSRSALKRRKPQMVYFTPQELAEILRRMRVRPVVDSQGVEVRIRDEIATYDADLVQLFATTGLRMLEMCRITLGDVRDGEIYVRRAKDASHPRAIPIGDDLAPVVQRLEAFARSQVRHNTSRERVLLVPGGPDRARATFQRWKKILGEPRLNGRSLRHSFITAVLVTGGTSMDAMAAAGHSSLSTTDRYVHVVSSRPGMTRSAVAAAFGLGSPPATASPAATAPRPAAAEPEQPAQPEHARTADAPTH